MLESIESALRIQGLFQRQLVILPYRTTFSVGEKTAKFANKDEMRTKAVQPVAKSAMKKEHAMEDVCLSLLLKA